MRRKSEAQKSGANEKLRLAKLAKKGKKKGKRKGQKDGKTSNEDIQSNKKRFHAC